jgi:hypothetical protein
MELTLATGTIMEIALKSAPSISPDPIGDMTLAPIMMTGRTEAELARAMAEHLQAARPGSGTEALRALRALRNAFPNSPLTLRVTALAALMRR